MSRLVQKVKKDISIVETMDISDLEKLVLYAKKKYYETSDPVLEDSVYDYVEEILKKRNPESEALIVGHKVPVSKQTKKETAILPYWMGSLDKIYPTDTGAFQRWKAKNTGPYLLSTKLDGVSSILHYNSTTRKWSLYSRGNGKLGSIWTENLKHLRIGELLHNLSFDRDIVIRGELIISKMNFDMVNAGQYLVPLAMVNGLMGSKNKNGPLINQMVDFQAYEFITSDSDYINDIRQQWNRLNEMGFTTPVHFITPELTVELLDHYYTNWREKSEYKLDGVVVTNCFIEQRYTEDDQNPSYSFAFKKRVEEQQTRAIVKEVEWNLSKDGYLKPTVIINPIIINGFTINKVTGYNAKYITDMSIGPNAEIVIARSGDVIPNIISVVKSANRPQLPIHIPFEWTEGSVDIIAIDYEENDQYIVKNINHLFKALEINGVSIGRIQKIVEHGYVDIVDVLKISSSDMVGWEGFGPVMSHHIVTEIKKAIDNSTIIQWMVGSNMFGRGFAEKRLKQILENIPDVIVRNDYGVLYNLLLNMDGFQEKTVDKFIEGLQRFQAFLVRLEENGIYRYVLTTTTTKHTEKKVNDNIDLMKKNVCMTGFRNSEISEWIEKHNGNVVSSVNSKTKLLIRKDETYSNSKTEKAVSDGIPVITEQEWIQIMKLSDPKKTQYFNGL